MESRDFFINTKPIKLFFRAAVPGMISMFSMSIYSLFEGMFIGKFLGSDAFAAMNLALPFVMINFALADLIGVGSAVPISIALGRGDEKDANNIFSCALVLIFSTTLVTGSMMVFFAPYMFEFMGAVGETAKMATIYLRAFAMCGPFCTVLFAMDNYLRICGFVKTSMVLNVFMSFLTIALLYVFIVVCKLGVVGSALASCVSMMLCSLLTFIPFLLKKTVLRFGKPVFKMNVIKQIVSCGCPTFLSTMAGRITSVVMNMVLLSLGGDDAVAIYGILMYSSDIIQPFLYGMSDSLQPAIGYNWGAGLGDRVKAIAKCVFTFAGIFSVVASFGMHIFGENIAGIFVESSDISLLRGATEAIKIFCFAYTIRWFSFCAQGFYTAIEMPFQASVLSVGSAMVFPLIVMLILWPLGLTGIWLNLAGTSDLMAVLSLFMLLKTQKKMKKDGLVG